MVLVKPLPRRVILPQHLDSAGFCTLAGLLTRQKRIPLLDRF